MEPESGRPVLEIKDLTAGYGEIVAFRDIFLDVAPGKIVTLIGANGAGKTSLLRTIAGILRPQKGEIEFDGKRIDRFPVYRIVQAGISFVQEGRAIFKRIKIEENLKAGAYLRNKKEMLFDMAWIYRRFPILEERRSQLAGTLSGGQQQMLAIARALMSRPKLMLLDEPSLGIAPIMVQAIYEIIQGLQSRGITILLVEQNARMALKVAERGYLMETGRIVMEGTSKELMNDPRVQEAYLGGQGPPQISKGH